MSATPPAQARPPRRALWLSALALALLTFAAYFPAIRGEFVWDDDMYAANPVLQQAGGLAKIWTLHKADAVYYPEFPVVYSTFWLERQLWGLNPAGFHAMNIVLHILNALLAWFILKKLGLRFAWLAAAVFALHPVHVESVAWISERKNVLSGFFYLLAVAGYLRFEEERGGLWYAGSLLLFAGALLSKAVTCTLPVALLLLHWQRGLKLDRRHALDLLPFFLLSAASGLFTLWVETRPVAADAVFSMSAAQRVLLAGRALWFYPYKLALPVNLCFSYPHWALNPRDPAQWLWVIVALGAGALLLRAGRRLDRGIRTGLGFYAVTIAPMLGFANIYTFRYALAADHYQYLASLGLIPLLAGGAAKLYYSADGREEDASRRRLAVLLFAAALLALLGLATWRQSGKYLNSERLWTDTLEKNPSSWMAQNNLGVYLDAHNRTAAAVAHYKEALRLNPAYAEAYYNCGVALAALGRTDEAAGYYRDAARVKPDYAEPNINYGLILASRGRTDEAIARYRSALRARPDYAEAHLDLGLALAGQNKFDEAIAHYDTALRLKPDYPEVHNNWGNTLLQLGRLEEAFAHFREALRLKPDYAEVHYNWGNALAGLGRGGEAIEHYREALRINPGYAAAQNNWGTVLAAAGRLDEAAVHFRAALKADPAFAPAQKNLEKLQGLKKTSAATPR